MSQPPAVTPTTITLHQVKNLLSLYPDVIEKHYASKIKDSKKVREAVERDRWRYEELPGALRGEGGEVGEMSLEVLQKLVLWKITHGHSRPFLPAMIRKNDPKTVTDTTLAAAEALRPLNIAERFTGQAIHDITLKALDIASKLTGVGPATASLILSVYAPDTVPFFSDELYEWLCPGGKKLKYDKKEYSEVVKGVWEVRKRLGMGVGMGEIEKGAFVLGHWALVDQADKKRVVEMSNPSESEAAEGEKEFVHGFEVRKEVLAADDEAIKGKSRQEGIKKGTKRGTPKPDSRGEKAQDDSGHRRSKRVKK